jgi:hypothetical protein
LLLIVVTLAAPARAQFYDEARRSVGFSLDGIERSPRLVGMGQLTYVGDDPHTAITLWDFAANPLGILQADSTNTIELYPGTSSLSDMEDLAGTPPEVFERQSAAARESRLAYEVWRRMAGRSAYGFAGDVAQLRRDELFSGTVERRSSLSQPTIMPVMTGRLPFVKTNRWLYSVRLFYSGEHSLDQYRGLAQNGQGEYIDQNGTELGPPEFFTPTDYSVRSSGGGLGLAYDLGRTFKAAVAVDGVQNEIKASSDGPRRSSRIHESRPYGTGQLTLVGGLGSALEWGVDGRGWRSHSIPGWDFSVSAGIGTEPLVGRGELLDREEEGTALRTRLRWTYGRFELGGGLSTGYRKITITPPDLGNLTSFNYFRDILIYRQNADSLALPDSVSASESSERTWEAGVGLTMRMPGQRGMWGVEFHRRRGITDQLLSDQVPGSSGATALAPRFAAHGPLHRSWDVRTGLEYRCTSVMTGRMGYMYRWDDRDAYTEQNEYLGHSMTLGLGLKPAGATWTFDVGYAVAWQRADFGSPAALRGSRQQLVSLVRWAF